MISHQALHLLLCAVNPSDNVFNDPSWHISIACIRQSDSDDVNQHKGKQTAGYGWLRQWTPLLCDESIHNNSLWTTPWHTASTSLTGRWRSGNCSGLQSRDPGESVHTPRAAPKLSWTPPPHTHAQQLQPDSSLPRAARLTVARHRRDSTWLRSQWFKSNTLNLYKWFIKNTKEARQAAADK